ncbi:Asp-tRNA(Asn)/Glu-tRNA(Gln) amidotransferase subunit GatA [candidate division WWE3 bacterium]|uniref:Glutamyl-tRNA(Gln) amidotransferase subunit A n=1 Tax=candidate division WWE3 bacterium TaxID=2053526 RepID=A0A955LH07_UNCKA|nr:Asp-tRNA(Asn)/Glu-tRNA(Gln) amidotransferase subunit GatA [candidate division WWE3 bacterium]
METISSLHKKLKSREITAESLVTTTIEKIETDNEDLNIFLHVDADSAIEQARKLDEQFEKGDAMSPLAGIPFSVKDAFNVENMPTQSASKILEGYRAQYTATPIKRLLTAGAICLGKNNQDAFGFGSSTENSDYGPVHNPWDKSKVAGGSSGGSAAAVAAEMSVFTIGEDTGGSIRLPASFCGVTGLKVTYGRVSRYGAIAFASSLDTIGPLARSAEDIAYVLSEIAGKDPLDATTLPDESTQYIDNLLTAKDLSGKRIGIPSEMMDDSVDPEIREALDNAIDILKNLGATIEQIELPFIKYGVGAYYITAPSEASSNLSRFDGIRYGYSDRSGTSLEDIYLDSKSTGYNDEAMRRIMIGTYALSSGYYDAYFDKAQRIRTKMKDDFTQAFETVDYIVGPVAPTLPFAIGEHEDDPLALWLIDVFTIPVNIAGVPSLSLPIGFSNGGLPIGMQIIGPQLSEKSLLQAGFLYQQQTDWHTRSI